MFEIKYSKMKQSHFGIDVVFTCETNLKSEHIEVLSFDCSNYKLVSSIGTDQNKMPCPFEKKSIVAGGCLRS